MPVLRRIMWSDGQPSRDAKDFSVMDDDRAVGRIYRTTNPRGEGYAWFIHGSSRHGFAPTREERRMESDHRWQTEKPAGRRSAQRKNRTVGARGMTVSASAPPHDHRQCKEQRDPCKNKERFVGAVLALRRIRQIVDILKSPLQFDSPAQPIGTQRRWLCPQSVSSKAELT
jgi:hypothetical protein